MKITFTGDILIYESQDKGCLGKGGKRNYRPIFEQVKPVLKEADYVVGSFETTLAGEEAVYTHAAYSFNTPDEVLSALKWAGFDMLTTANNHCFDRGAYGHARTIEMLEKDGMDYTGTRLSNDAPSYLLKDFDGTKVAFLAYTYGTNSADNGYLVPKGKEYLVNLTRRQEPLFSPIKVAPIKRPLWKKIAKAALSLFFKKKNAPLGSVVDCVEDVEIANGRNVEYEERMLDTIGEAKKNADIVIMCLHSGGQFNSKVGAYTQHLFEIIADAGVDAIVCNHAHTILPIIRRGNCLIASALGNFSFAPGEGYWVDGVNAEYSALLTLNIDKKKIISHDIDICKCYYNDNGLAVTTIVSDKNIVNLIKKRLCSKELIN